MSCIGRYKRIVSLRVNNLFKQIQPDSKHKRITNDNVCVALNSRNFSSQSSAAVVRSTREIHQSPNHLKLGYHASYATLCPDVQQKPILVLKEHYEKTDRKYRSSYTTHPNLISLPSSYPSNSIRTQYNRTSTCLQCCVLLGKTNLKSKLCQKTNEGSLNINRSYSTSGEKNRLMLMDFPEILWPHALKSLKNKWFSLLIRGYYDNDFTVASFLEGAMQAVVCVSRLIGDGDFDELEGLVDSEAVAEIKNNFADLNESQRRFIPVKMEDIYFQFVHEIGMMFDDNSNKRFVEITVVLQGLRGYGNVVSSEDNETQQKPFFAQIQERQDDMYICNYRFIREYTKGVESDWTINKLNHFSPKEFMEDR